MFFRKNEQGQVLVEAAIVMPLMVFFTLGIMQMTMMQQARIMTDYAAYAAARSGVVNNANPDSMSAAANIAVLPTRAKTNSLKSLAKAYLMYTIGDYINKQIQNVFSGLGSGLFATVAALVQAKIQAFLRNSLGINTFGFANVAVINPLYSDFTDISGRNGGGVNHAGVPQEDDFDNLDDTFANKKTARGITSREKNILSVAVSYNYELKIPFANWIIFEMWAATQVGIKLSGAIWSSRAQLSGMAGTLAGRSNVTGNGGIITRGMTKNYLAYKMASGITPKNVFQKIRIPLRNLWALQKQGIYIIPIYGSYSMRMHSNVYKSNLSQELENTLMGN